MIEKIYIYNDIGVSSQSLKQIIYTIKQIVSIKYKIETIDAGQILSKAWLKDAALLVIPGGADIHYANRLNGCGNKLIKNYVMNGGKYLGICAGAYYGSNMVEFDLDGPLEIVEKRELSFFPNKAIGPIIAKYNYNNNSGSRAVSIRTMANIGSNCSVNQDIAVYYNGGPYFKDAHTYKNVDIIANYQISLTSSLPAIVKIKYGKGIVILSAIHFEYSTQLMKDDDEHHALIIPELKLGELNRVKFATYIFRQLNIDTYSTSFI